MEILVTLGLLLGMSVVALMALVPTVMEAGLDPRPTRPPHTRRPHARRPHVRRPRSHRAAAAHLV